MDTSIANDLNQELPSEFHATMLQDGMSLVNISRGDMSSCYDRWDRNMDIFKGYRAKDDDDQKSEQRKEPVKMVVPVSFSQIQTFVAFCMSLYTQREKFFELLPVGPDDARPATIGEAFLQRDLDASKFELKLQQFLLDVSRCGFGVLKTVWVDEKAMVERTIQQPGKSFFGFKFGVNSTITVKELVTKFLGNRILTVSPYRFFPDTRLPLSRFQEGEFCASEDVYSRTALKQMEKDGLVSGIDFVPALNPTQFVKRWGQDEYRASREMIDRRLGAGAGQSQGSVLVTEIQRVIIPSKYMVEGKPLSDSDDPTKYVIWIANDSRVIKCEPLGFAHNEFTYSVGQFCPDDHEVVGMSFSDTINMLQDVISWFINSRITSVRKVIQNRLVVNPSGIEWKDLQDRAPVIRLKPEAMNRDVSKSIMQLKVDDVTQSHLQDVNFLHNMVQITTGVNDTLLGQFQGGRRTATEQRGVASSAAARLKIVALSLFRAAIEPMGKQMLSNLQQGLTIEQVARVVGVEKAIEGQTFVKATKEDLMGSYDFEVFDGTLPSEKGNAAMTLENILAAFIKNPQAALALQMDPRKMLLEALELRGIRNPERFTLNVPQAPQQSTNENPAISPYGGAAEAVPPTAQGVTGESGISGGLSGLIDTGEQPVG
jgi:hypothetical protein